LHRTQDDTHDVIVLGAGMVGTCAALALVRDGFRVALVDRQDPGNGTSFGNAGLVESVPDPVFAFPRSLPTLLAASVGRLHGFRLDYRALPGLAGWLARYWTSSSPDRLRLANDALRSLTKPAPQMHRELAASAGYDGYRADGTIEYGSSDSDVAAAKMRARDTGIEVEDLSLDRLLEIEPALNWKRSGIMWTDSGWYPKPAAAVAAYCAAFEAEGGTLFRGDAERIDIGASDRITLPVHGGELRAARAVVALGPWSPLLFKRLGYSPPFALKRGYSRSYAFDAGTALPDRPVVFASDGIVMTRMGDSLRLVTGVEFAPASSGASRAPIRAAEAVARRYLPGFGQAKPRTLWMGHRPCMPDMLPLIGAVPGRPNIYLSTAHNHWGICSAPASAAIVTDMLAGREPQIDPRPFSPARFA
jgi:D-amino-acid dehydrogenase